MIMLHDIAIALLLLVTLGQCALTEDLVVCDRSRITAQFTIPAPKPCQLHRSHTVGACQVQIFNPTPNSLRVPMFSCTLSITRWTSTHFFFGAKREKIFDPIFRPISVSRCNKIAYTLHDSDLGKLFPITGGSYGTAHAVTPSYVWPRGMSGEVFNIIFTNTSFIFEHSSRRMLSPLANLKHCEITSGFCSNEHQVFLWAFNETFLCPSLTESKSNSTAYQVELHYKEDGSLFSITVPDMALSFHRDVDCTVFTKSCFAGKIFCACPMGLYLSCCLVITRMQRIFLG